MLKEFLNIWFNRKTHIAFHMVHSGHMEIERKLRKNPEIFEKDRKHKKLWGHSMKS